MAINLLDMLKDQVGSQLVSQASSFLGENADSTGKALDGIFPSLLGTLIQKGTDEGGAGDLLNMLSGNDGSIIEDIGNIFGGGSSAVEGLLNNGSGIISSLLGDKIGGIVKIITSLSGLKDSSAGSLLNMAAPFIMGMLGRQVKNNGLGISGLMDLLSSQKDAVADALPAGMGSALGLTGFNLGELGDMAKDAISTVAGTSENIVSGAADMGRDAIDKTSELASDTLDTGKRVIGTTASVAGDAIETGAKTGKSMLRWLIPLILLLMLLSWLGFKTCSPVDDAAQATKDAATGVIETTSDAAGAVTDAAGDLASASAEFIGGALSNVNEAARSALSNIQFAAGSIGEQMIEYIDGGGKGNNEFRFNAVNFESGSSNLTRESLQEIDRLAQILSAYPGLRMLIEGHTDNTGSEDANLQISQARADAVKARLANGGIAIDRIDTRGFGSSKPIADNSTEEGRSQNRRIDLRFIQ